MITGHKPNGYYTKGTANGLTVEGESRQCVHCQALWEYQPGSGTVRGWCLKCNGFLCNQPSCAREQQRLIARFPDQTRSCMPFADWNQRMRDAYEKDHRYQVLPSGIVIEAS